MTEVVLTFATQEQADDATIVSWKPFPCKYPKKRCIKEGMNNGR